ncbi:MmyB family transcriptional regulator [Arthrobacter sp. S2(2024)]|uniref:MmyB family transcriptional regulator n=1 Tax=Arthrobacter sp. S2(2024) TaxID=3111911 RepID=UPI002FC7E3DA
MATLRSYAGRQPHNKGLSDLVGELATRSEEFRTRWAAHNVRFHRTGIKRMHHPVVGDLELSYEAMELPANPGWTMFAYTPGTRVGERRTPETARELGGHHRKRTGGAGVDLGLSPVWVGPPILGKAGSGLAADIVFRSA